MSTRGTNVTRYIGCGTVLAFIVLALCGLTWWALAFMVISIGIDAGLMLKDKTSISSVWRGFLPKWADYVLLAVLGGLTWWLVGPLTFVILAAGVTIGHLEWNH